MALYVYSASDGSLYSWNHNDDGQVADTETLTANGFEVVFGLPDIDDTHDWDPVTKTIIEVPQKPKPWTR